MYYSLIEKFTISHLTAHAVIVLPKIIAYLDEHGNTELTVKQLSAPLWLPKWLLEKGLKDLVAARILKERYFRTNQNITKRRLELTVSTKGIVDEHRDELLPIEGPLLSNIGVTFLQDNPDSQFIRKQLRYQGLKGASLENAEQDYLAFLGRLPKNYRYKLLHMYLCFITHSNDAYQLQLSYKEISRLSGFNVDRVRRLIKLLDELALVKRIYSRADTEKAGISHTRYLINPAHPVLLVTPQFMKLKRLDISEHTASPEKIYSTMIRMGLVSVDAFDQEERSKLEGILDAASIANVCLLYGWAVIPKQFIFTSKPLAKLTQCVLLAFRGYNEEHNTQKSLPSFGKIVEELTGMDEIKASKDTSPRSIFKRKFEEVKQVVNDHTTEQLNRASTVYRSLVVHSFSVAVYLYLTATRENLNVLRLPKNPSAILDWIYLPAELSHTLSPVVYLVPKTPVPRKLENINHIARVLTSPDTTARISLGLSDHR